MTIISPEHVRALHTLYENWELVVAVNPSDPSDFVILSSLPYPRIGKILGKIIEYLKQQCEGVLSQACEDIYEVIEEYEDHEKEEKEELEERLENLELKINQLTQEVRNLWKAIMKKQAQGTGQAP